LVFLSIRIATELAVSNKRSGEQQMLLPSWKLICG
jgi:hypothetical protein